jgi:hypothetical protein
VANFINTNSHAASFYQGRAVAAGARFQASGDDADKWGNVPGVVEADSKEGKQYLADHPAAAETDLRLSPSLQAITEAREQLGVAQSAPNRIVIGDDEAPLGPPQGTVTTKELAAGDDPVLRDAFVQGEARPGSQDLQGTGPAHSDQAVRTEAAEAFAQKLVDASQSSSDGGDYAGRNKADLQEEAYARGLEVEGTGSGGAVTRDDLVDALKADDDDRSRA